MHQNLVGREAQLRAGLYKQSDFFAGKRLGLPLPLVLGEHAQCIGAKLMRPDKGVFQPSCYTGVGSNGMHRRNLEL